jgi:ADP-ribosylation factor-binding protein GGA
MLNEMLDNMKPNEKFAEGDAFDQIASRCRNVQPKIQKWISNAEEHEDADTIGRLQLYTHITHRHDH